MQRPSIKIRALALFVTVFICLNGAGAACVSYCRSIDKAEPSSDHCPLKKLSEHCEPNGPYFSARGNGFDFCPMTVSFFAGPVEKGSFAVNHLAVAAILDPATRGFSFHSPTPIASMISYRGPPPIDRRPDRIKHRVLRI